MSDRDRGKLVPLWLFDEVQRVIDEMTSLSHTGGHVYIRVSPEALRDWIGLMCALKYVSGEGVTQEDVERTTLILHTGASDG